MASPGGIEAGRVSIRVVPDTSHFATDLRADLRRIQSEIKVDIPVSLDTSGVVEHARAAGAEAQRAAGKVQIKTSVDSRSLRTTARDLTRFTSGLSFSLSTLLRASGFAAIGVTALASVPKVINLAVALSQLVGIVGLIPAAAAGAIATMGTLALGFHGFGTALTALGKDQTAKFNAALKNLSPNARAAAVAIKSLVPQFRALRAIVQQHLFAGLASDIRSTVRVVLPSLRVGLAQVANGLNLIIHNSALAVQGLAKSGALRTTFTNIGKSLQLIAPAIADFLQSFGQIAAIGSQFLPGIAGGLQTAATAFRDFIDTPKGANAVKGFIQTALTGFGQLFDIVKALGSSLGGVVRAAQAAGGGTLANLATILQQVADVINSPAFQTGLTTVFLGLEAGAHALAGSLPAIGGALVALAPAIATFATGIGQILAAAVNALAPAIVTLAPAFNSLLVALTPQLVAGINALAPALQSIAQYLAQNKPLLIAVAAGILALAAPTTAVVIALLLLAANFGKIADFFQTKIVPIFNQVVQALQPTITAFQGLGVSIIAMFQTVAPIFAQLFAIVQQNFPQIRQIVVQAFSTIQSYIVLVLTIVTFDIKAATAIIQFIWSHFGASLVATIKEVLPPMLRLIGAILSEIQGIFRLFTAIIKGDWSGAWAAVKQIVASAIAVVKSTVQLGLALLKGIARLALDAFILQFKTLGKAVIGAIGDIGSLFIGVGRDIVGGIVSGIHGAAGSIGSALKSAATGALTGVAKHLGINSPSKLFAKEIGSPIAEGIAFGITENAHRIPAAVIKAVSPPSINGASVAASLAGGMGGGAFAGANFYSYDPTDILKASDQRQRDAVAIYGLAV